MEIKIDTLLKRRGKTRYWLAKETGITYPSIMKLCNGETVSINFDTLEVICRALECWPNDILQIERD